MSDAQLEAALRAWRAEPTDAGLSELLRLHRRAGRELPWDVVAARPRWRGLVTLIRDWFTRPLAESDGETLEALAAAEARIGVPLPEALRELYRLIGRRDDLPQGVNPLPTLAELFLEEGTFFSLNQAGAGNPMWTFPARGDPDPEVEYIDEPTGTPLSRVYLARLIRRLDHLPGVSPDVQVQVSPHAIDADERAAIEASYPDLRLPYGVGLEDDLVRGDAETLVFLRGERATLCARTPAAAARARAWQRVRWPEQARERSYDVLDDYRDAEAGWVAEALLIPCAHLGAWWGGNLANGEEADVEQEADVDRLPDVHSLDLPQRVPLRDVGDDPTGWLLLLDDEHPWAFVPRPSPELLLVAMDRGERDDAALSVAAQVPDAWWELDVARLEVPPGGLALLESIDDGRDPPPELPVVHLPPGPHAVDRIQPFSALAVHGPEQEEPLVLTLLRLRPLS